MRNAHSSPVNCNCNNKSAKERAVREAETQLLSNFNHRVTLPDRTTVHNHAAGGCFRACIAIVGPQAARRLQNQKHQRSASRGHHGSNGRRGGNARAGGRGLGVGVGVGVGADFSAVDGGTRASQHGPGLQVPERFPKLF